MLYIPVFVHVTRLPCNANAVTNEITDAETIIKRCLVQDVIGFLTGLNSGSATSRSRKLTVLVLADTVATNDSTVVPKRLIIQLVLAHRQPDLTALHPGTKDLHE